MLSVKKYTMNHSGDSRGEGQGKDMISVSGLSDNKEYVRFCRQTLFSIDRVYRKGRFVDYL